MRIDPNYSKEFEYIARAYEQAGGKVDSLLTKDMVSIIISGDKVLGRNSIEGVTIDYKTEGTSLKLWMKIADNVKILKPVHMCVGFLEKYGEQNLEYFFDIGCNSEVSFLSHCSFPNAQKIKHSMVSHILARSGSKVGYEDVHFHNEEGWVDLNTDYLADVGTGSSYSTRFRLTKTRVGSMKVLMNVDLAQDAKAFLETKVWAKKDDKVDINEIVNLNGKGASGIAKTYVIAQDESQAKVVNEAYGNAPYSKGHIECTEIVKGNGVEVSTIPILKVKNELAELTHEASVGRINALQLETLMAKGLTEEEATELIIRGFLT